MTLPRSVLVFSFLLALGCSGSSGADVDTDDAGTTTDDGGDGSSSGSSNSDGSASGSASSGAATTTATASTTDDSSSGDPTTGNGDDDAAAPLYDEAVSYSIDPLPVLGDPTDIYVPVAPGETFPVAVLLQGANVDKQYYSEFASLVARYGFIVVVPNHTSSGVAGTGLFMEQGVIVDVLAGVNQLSADMSSDIGGRVDPSVAGLLGHSYGGVVGVYALTGQCTFPFCQAPFELPAAVQAGIFYGTNMRPPLGGAIGPLNNGGLGIGLVQGTTDSKAAPADAVETYDQIQSPPAALVTVLGANHYGLTDVDNPEGADAESSASTLDQAVTIETSARFSAMLLRGWLLDDADALDYVGSQSDSNATVQLNL